MSTVACPNGHLSGDPEWCDTCGAPIGGPSVADPAAASLPAGSTPATSFGVAGAVAPVACPHCGAMNSADNLFCESCGYDFTTGQTPDPVVVAGPVAVDPSAAPAEAAGSPWIVVVEVDPAWFALKGELAGEACPPPSTFTVTISGHASLIGRTSQSQALHPELALDNDTAVSRRHAQLVIDGPVLSVVDLSSTNGTYVHTAAEQPSDASQPLASGVATVLHDGDRVYVGAWSRLTVRAG